MYIDEDIVFSVAGLFQGMLLFQNVFAALFLAVAQVIVLYAFGIGLCHFFCRKL